MVRENNSIKFRMGLGFNGQISRIHSFKEAVHLKHGNIPNFGTAVKYDGDFVVPLAAGDAADKVAGIYARPYASASTAQLDAILNSDEYNYVGDILKKGYMTVYVGSLTDVKRGDAVYVRNANPTTDSPLGAILTTATDAVLLQNTYFMTDADESGIAEIAYKI